MPSMTGTTAGKVRNKYRVYNQLKKKKIVKLTHANAFEGEGGGTDHKSKVLLVNEFDVRASAMEMDLIRSVVEDTDETEQNEDIGNDGTVRQACDFSDPAERNDSTKDDPNVVFALKGGVAIVQSLNDELKVFRNEDQVGSNETHLGNAKEEEDKVSKVTTIEFASHVAVGAAHLSLSLYKQLEGDETNRSNDNHKYNRKHKTAILETVKIEGINK